MTTHTRARSIHQHNPTQFKPQQTNKTQHDATNTGILKLQVDKGVALADVVRELHPWVFNIEALGPPHVRASIVEKLADVEHRLACGASERLQLGSLVAAFALARDEIVAAAV